MGAGPVAHIWDVVFYPECGTYPIVSGNPFWLELGLPVAHIGSLVACPGGGWIIQGSPVFLTSSIPVSRLGDAAASATCGPGVIISGSPTLMTT